MKILVNTISTKKQAGGAFQIAYNFMLKTLEHTEVEWVYIVSEDLNTILPEIIKKRNNYFVFPTQPDFKKSYKRVKKELSDLIKKVAPDVVYSITAPSYFTFEVTEVMRFTNPLVTHPNKYSWKVQPLVSKLRLVAYCWNQKRMMRKAKYFITQTETTKRGIMRITGVEETHVKVVKNVLPTVFKGIDTTHIESGNEWIDIACIAAPVPHKNLDIIPIVLKTLSDKGYKNVRFHVTIPNDTPILSKIESELKKYHLENGLINHGRCKQQDLIDVYRRCEYCFLPTLLEVFSVSSLEAMFFDLKIVATDFPFNKDVLSDACLYYQPMNAEDAANQFVRLFNDMSARAELSKRMKKQLTLFDDYDNHFNSILSFLKDVAQHRI